VAWRGGERSAKAIEARMRRFLEAFPEVQVEYIAVAEPDALAPVAEVQATTIVALAARVGLTRLIDNIVLGEGVG
jgi:pantothenate synthetase